MGFISLCHMAPHRDSIHMDKVMIYNYFPRSMVIIQNAHGLRLQSNKFIKTLNEWVLEF